MLSSIGISPLPLLGQIINFLILFFVFKKFLFGPILKNLDKRANKQKQAIKAAEETIRIKEELMTNEKKTKLRLQQDIEKELDKAIKEAGMKKEELIQRARQEAKEAAQKEYEVFSKKIQEKEAEVKKDLSALVVTAAKKVLSEHLDKTANKKIVANQIDKLKKIKI